MLISIVIATRNRRRLLERSLESVRSQSFRDFECIVVNDGSNDDTKEFLDEYQNSAEFELTVCHQDHCGKHVALNRASDVARGVLYYILDSDDCLMPGSLVSVANHWEKFRQKEKDVAGIVGLAVDTEGKRIGSRLPVDSEIESWGKVYYEMGWKGDKVMIVRTDLMKAHPFPVIEGERFLAEGIIWDTLAVQGARFGFVNEPLTKVEYQSDGLSATIDRLRAENPKGAMLVYSHFLTEVVPKFHVSWWDRLRGGANYVRFGLHRKWERSLPFWGNILLNLLAVIIGCGFFIADRIRFRTISRGRLNSRTANERKIPIHDQSREV